MRASRILLAAAAGLVLISGGALWADEPAPAEKPKLKLNRAASAVAAKVPQDKDADAKAADGDEAKKDDAEKKEEKKERFVVPEGDVKTLLAFLQETMSFRPRTREEMVDYQTKGSKAMQEAAEKIKKLATDEDKKLPGYSDVDGVLLLSRVRNGRLSDDDLKQLADDLKKYFGENAEPSRYGLMAAQMLGSTLERGPNPQEAIAIYRELGPALAKSPNEQFARVGRKMEGSVRRLELPGNAMEITGTQADGNTFDWAKYRGKVVLVDFWATWCGPCIGELPNVRKNYELYHDKGFDVVGISLDSDAKRLEEFVKNEELPWTTIYEGGGWDTPMAVYYGINSIPRAILVDKEGKVVSMAARGEELGKLLGELLGPVEEKKSDEAASKDEEKKDEKKDDK